MTGLLVKVVICPLVLIISDTLSTAVNFSSIFHSIILGLILAAAGHILELLILREQTFWIITALDFAAALAIIYYSQFLITGISVTFAGALFAAVLLTVTEYFQHLYIIHTGRREKI